MMASEQKADKFFQEVPFQIALPKPIGSGELNMIMKSAGIELFYDVYAKRRGDKGASWQSETFANVDTLLYGERSDAQEGCDALLLSYPLATIDASYIPKFARLAAELSSSFGVPISYEGKAVDESGIVEILCQKATKLMQEWGEEPGSKTLRILIESSI
ncbi:MAG: hypothetical protein IPK97_20410 [Ahniella sp.]|nr:hypothetical protein [Ahniella sp.]